MDTPNPFNKAILLENFMKTISFVHCNTAMDDADAVNFCKLINKTKNHKNSDSVSYDAVKCFRMMNVGVIDVNKDNHSYYDYIIQKDCDILTNISVHAEKKIKLSYFIGNIECDFNKITELVLCKIIYDDIKLRITFLERPITQDEFKIYSRRYFIDKTPRRLLLNSAVKTKYLGYLNGNVHIIGE